MNSFQKELYDSLKDRVRKVNMYLLEEYVFIRQKILDAKTQIDDKGLVVKLKDKPDSNPYLKVYYDLMQQAEQLEKRMFQ